MGADPADLYTVRLLTRCTIAGRRYPVGTLLRIPADRLRVAAWLVRNGSCRPIDEDTRRDIEVFEALREL